MGPSPRRSYPAVMWRGNELDNLLMRAAVALDLGRWNGGLSDCEVLLLALILAEDPTSDDGGWACPECLIPPVAPNYVARWMLRD